MSNYTEITKMITDEFASQLDKGIVPWHKDWSLMNKGFYPQYLAYSFVTKKAYDGINQLLLGKGVWATYDTIIKNGGHTKGKKSKFVVKFKWVEYECEENVWGAYQKEENGKWYHKVPLLRYFRVFNVEECGIKVVYDELDENATIGGVSKIDSVETTLNDYITNHNIIYREELCNSAYYSPTQHLVNMPLFSQFDTMPSYYATKCHELIHSTARYFDRECTKHFDGFGGQVYSKEELIAEMGSAYCMSWFHIDTKDTKQNSIAYLQSWAKVLRDDTSISNKIIGIVTQATNAFKLVCGITELNENEED